MLVLTRKKNDVVVVTVGGVDVLVTIAEIRGDRVRIGFTAPQEVSIMRQELIDQQTRVDEINKQQE